MRSLRLRVLLCLTGAAVGLTFLFAGAALAYFVTTDSSNPATAEAATLSAPTGGAQNGTAAPASIPIRWNTPSGYTATGYTVLRCTGPSCTNFTAISNGSCHGTISGTTCTDTDSGLAAGITYSYEVQAQFHNWISPPSTSFQGSTTAVAQLGFTTQPGAGTTIAATGTGSFNVSVAIEDANGNVASNDISDTVTLAIASGHNPGAGTLTCTGGLTATVSSGVANFTGCAISKSGNGYQLTATSATKPSLTSPANANSFNIGAGTLTQYAVGVAATATAGTPVTGVTLTAVDADGNTVTTDNASNQAITWSGPQTSPNGTAPALPNGSVSFSSGVSTTSLSVTFTRTGSQTLTASDGSHAGSAATTVSAGALARYVVGGVPATTTAGTQANGVTLTAVDSDGNTVTTDNASNQAITWSGPQTSPNGTAPALPNGSVSFSSGVSTTSLSVTFTHTGSQTLTATDGSSRTGSATTTVSGAAPASLVLANCSVTGNVTPTGCASSYTNFGNGTNGSVTADVQVLDPYGNAAAFTGSISVSVAATSGNTGAFTVTGSPLTITSPSNQSSGTFKVAKSSTGSKVATITVSSSGLPNLTFTVAS